MIMKHGLLNPRDDLPQCALCEYGHIVDNDTEVLCPRNGVMKPDGACGSYKYDPLKRKPKKTTLQSQFDAEDFSL